MSPEANNRASGADGGDAAASPVCARSLVVALAVLLVTGCTHTVRPPAAADRPARVFLLDHGRTSSVVLSQGETLVRYSYGEWDWYAQNRTGVFRASGALGAATRGALGRRVLEAEPELAAVREAVAVPIESAWRIPVPAERARSLANDLDEMFRAQADEAVDNPRVALRFVPHPAEYSLAHNSNHVTASWLRRLGCRVEMRGPWSHWRVVPGGAP